MARDVGRLAAYLSLNNSKFVSGIAGAETRMAKFVTHIRASGSKLTSLLLGGPVAALAKISALAGGISVAGLVLFGKKVGEQLDAAGKMADSLGTTSEKFAGLGLAGELAGVDIEGISKAMTILTKTAGNAAAGVAQDTKMFRALGLEGAKLANMDATDRLGVVADRIAALPNQAQKAAAALAVMGKSGIGMLPLLQGGSKGLKDAAEEAEKLGLAITRIDIAKIEAMNDSWSKVKKVFTGIATQLLSKIAPFITVLTDKFVDWAKSGGGVPGLVKKGIDLAIAGIGKMLDLWRTFELGVLRVKVWFTEMGIGLVNAFNVVAKKLDPKSTPIDLKPMFDALMKSAAQWSDLKDQPLPSEKFAAWGKGISDKASAMAAVSVKNARSLGSLGMIDVDALDEVAEKTKPAAEGVKNLSDGVRQLTINFQKLDRGMGGSGSWLTTAFSLAGPGAGSRGGGNGGRINIPEVNIPHRNIPGPGANLYPNSPANSNMSAWQRSAQVMRRASSSFAGVDAGTYARATANAGTYRENNPIGGFPERALPSFDDQLRQGAGAWPKPQATKTDALLTQIRDLLVQQRRDGKPALVQ